VPFGSAHCPLRPFQQQEQVFCEMGTKNMYRSISTGGGFHLVEGENVLGLLQAVGKKLSPHETFGEGYDIGCLGLNISCINEDVEAGEISQPADFDQWVDAIVNEYRSNLALFHQFGR
jgi:hypothetical protein